MAGRVQEVWTRETLISYDLELYGSDLVHGKCVWKRNRPLVATDDSLYDAHAWYSVNA